MRSVNEHATYLLDARTRAERGIPPLLHSLSEAREVIVGIITAAGIRSICEIGSEGGLLTAALHSLYSAGTIDRLTIIEPYPTDAVRAYADGKGCVVDARISLDALPDAAGFDLYIVDGDHNYYTVHAELEHIFSKGGDPLVILHDVCWPCAQRDQYYNPSQIPSIGLHPHSYEGAIVHGSTGFSEFGFESRGAFAISSHEGGPKNGVFTAIHDFVQSRDLKFDSIPAIFGIAFVRNQNSSHEHVLRSMLPTPEIVTFLSRIDENRLENYLARIELENRLDRMTLAYDAYRTGKVGLFALAKSACRAVFHKGFKR